ncbi:MAG: alpha/beta hydrolase [Bacteroidia bacterium]|jgi:hypothetical protein|nr:alpha/beta hydrolase [Bacteroidia bacterium]
MAEFKHYVITTRQVKKSDGPPVSFTYKSDKNNAEYAQAFMRAGQYVSRKSIRKDQSIVVLEPQFFNHISANRDEDDDFEYHGSITSVIPQSATEPGAGTTELFNHIFDELEQSGKALLIFMYGYANKVNKELNHVELLDHAYVQPNTAIGSVLIVSWPSQGLLDFEPGNMKKWNAAKNEYFDEMNTDVKVTGYNLAVLFLKLAAFVEKRKQENRFVPPMHFMPQSMGHRIVDVMMKVFAAQPQGTFQRVHKLFHKLILMSPDIHENALDPANTASIYKNVQLLAQKTFVVYSIDDPVLPVSKQFNGYNILGISGPKGKPDDIISIGFNQTGQPAIQDQPKTPKHRFFQYHKKAIFVFNQILAGYEKHYPDKTTVQLDWNKPNWLPAFQNYDYLNDRPAQA